MSHPASESTLLDQIGGEVALPGAVDRFYERVHADPDLSGFFTAVSMSRLKAHQFAFLTQALGGPRHYSGALMRDAHTRLAIQRGHFDAVAAHLVETLRELGVSEETIAGIAAALMPLSAQIVNTATPQTALA